MNNKVILIAVLTVLALVILTLFTFGPLSDIRKQADINPASLHPSQDLSPQTDRVKTYNNVDVKENYYQVSIPASWQIGAGSAPGGYAVRFPGGEGEIRLMDVPDNTTLELYVLSQEEPRLKKSFSGYQRQDYRKKTVNGNEAYELLYNNGQDKNSTTTAAVYIAGPDHAGVISLGTVTDKFPSLSPAFDKVINSFNWQNK